MEVKVEMTKAKYIAFFKSGLARSLTLMFLISFSIALLCSSFINYNPFNWNDFLIDTLIYFIIYQLLIYVILFLKYSKQLKKLDERSYTQVYTLRSDGINIIAEKGNIFYKWADIRKVKEFKGFILIRIDRKLLYGIPKSSFATPEDGNEFLQTARNGINETKKRN